MSKKLLYLIFPSLILLSACQAKPLFEQKEISGVDKTIYDQAIGSQNLELCATIENSSLKNECAEIIEGQTITASAVEDLDADECTKVENSQLRESCLLQVQGLIKEKEADKAGDQLAEEEKLKLQEIQDNLDLEACNAITTENLKNDCILNTARAIAEKTKDKTVCQAVKNEDLRSDCEKAASTVVPN